jgi:heptosyltransferase-2
VFLIDRYLKPNMLRMLERFFSKDPISPREVHHSEIRRILVIRQHDQLGDFLLATPVLRALRNRYPDARIGLLVRDYFADVASRVPGTDEVLVFRANLLHWTFKRFTTLWNQLHKRWDMAVVLNTVSHSLTSDVLAYLSGARYIVGSEAHLFPGCGRNFFYNVVAPLHRPPRHQTDRNLDIVRILDADTQDLSEEIRISESERLSARDRFSEACPPTQLLIGMHIGAGKKPNRWPVKNFAGLAQEVREKFGAEVVLFWGPKERDLCREFCRSVNFKPIAIEPSSILQLAACFSQCSATVCNDTGVMHLAAAVGVPLVAIFGPTNPGEWMPIGKNCASIRGEHGITEYVSPEQVLRELQNLLGGKLKPSADIRSMV